MGQRFQTIFILPPIYMNEKNPNNRDKAVIPYHYQWLYGFMACKVNLNILKRLKESIKKKNLFGYNKKTNKKDYINHNLESSINNAVIYASNVEINNERNFHKLDTIELKNDKKLSEIMFKQDNNNGYFLVFIDEKLNIGYSFISGLEDEDKNNIKTPEEYFRLFYSKEDFDKLSKKDKKIFSDFKKFKQIDKDKLENTLDELNTLVEQEIK